MNFSFVIIEYLCAMFTFIRTYKAIFSVLLVFIMGASANNCREYKENNCKYSRHTLNIAHLSNVFVSKHPENKQSYSKVLKSDQDKAIYNTFFQGGFYNAIKLCSRIKQTFIPESDLQYLCVLKI